VIEKYYVRRLRSFTNSCEVGPRLLSQALLKKAVCLNTDNITRLTAFMYLEPSERSDGKYEVDISVSMCMREAGKHGRFCKHQEGILKCFSLLPPNAPGVNAEAKHRISILALSNEAKLLSFYQQLRSGGDQLSQINTVDCNDSNVRSHSDECNIETIETEEEVPQIDNTVCENADDEKCSVLLPSLNHCIKHLEHLRCPLINCYVIMAQPRLKTSEKVSLQLLVE
jgi:hypothetical protein